MVDVISLHKPRWDDLPPARTFFDHYAAQFAGRPIKPFLFSEPVPEYAGDASRQQGIVRMLWGTALGGAGVIFQNDTSWGFAPRTAMAAKAVGRAAALDVEGHLAKFLNDPALRIAGMAPHGELSSTGVCLANPRSTYIIYVQDGARFSVDLSAAAGHTLTVLWLNPITGQPAAGAAIEGGQAAQFFRPPWHSDAVLRLNGDS